LSSVAAKIVNPMTILPRNANIFATRWRYVGDVIVEDIEIPKLDLNAAVLYAVVKGKESVARNCVVADRA
jgi:hypothetical protein